MANGEAATSMGHESDNPEEPDRRHNWEDHIDRLNREEEPCPWGELTQLEARFTLADRMEAFGTTSVESEWRVQGDASDCSDEDN